MDGREGPDAAVKPTVREAQQTLASLRLQLQERRARRQQNCASQRRLVEFLLRRRGAEAALDKAEVNGARLRLRAALEQATTDSALWSALDAARQAAGRGTTDCAANGPEAEAAQEGSGVMGSSDISAGGPKDLELSLSATLESSANVTMGSLSLTPFATPPGGQAARAGDGQTLLEPVRDTVGTPGALARRALPESRRDELPTPAACEDLQDAHRCVQLAEGLQEGARADFRGSKYNQKELLLKAIELNPKLGRAYADLGCVLSAEGQGASVALGGIVYSEVDLHARAIELDPQLQVAYENLADCLGSGGTVNVAGKPMGKQDLLKKARQISASGASSPGTRSARSSGERDLWGAVANEVSSHSLEQNMVKTPEEESRHPQARDLWGAVANLKATKHALQEPAPQRGPDARAADATDGSLREGDAVTLTAGKHAGKKGEVTGVDMHMGTVSVMLESFMVLDCVKMSDLCKVSAVVGSPSALSVGRVSAGVRAAAEGGPPRE